MKYKKGNLLYWLICFCVLTVATIVFTLSNYNYNKAEHKIIDFDNKNIKSIYMRISDVYGTENQKSLSDFFSEKDALQRMKNLNKFMNENFDYIEYDIQNLLIKKDFQYKEEFRVDYDTSFYGENDEFGISLKSIQVGEKAYDIFELEKQLDKGNGFTSDNFVFTDQNNIPVILGYDYIDLVNIGDNLMFEYLFKDISVTVVGFLQKDAFISLNDNIVFVDQYIILPSLNLEDTPVNLEDKQFQELLYSTKNWGYIKINDGDDYYNYKNKIDNICKELDLKYIANESYVTDYIRNISNTMNSSKGIFLIASIILLFAMSTIFVFVHIWNYNKNKKTYAIHLICGCSMLKLKLKILSSVLLQFILSVSTSTVISSIIIGQNNLYSSELQLLNESLRQTIIITLVLMLIIDCMLYFYIQKSNVYTSIRQNNER